MSNTSNRIYTEISADVVKFTPGGTPASFTVTVMNESDQFASFQLEIEAHGTDGMEGADWYALLPEVSTKKPPGDRTQFTVSITDTPVPGFVGTMNLTVRVFSLELRQEDRLLVRLVVEPGVNTKPIQMTLSILDLKAKPGELVEIPVQLNNPSQPNANVEVRLVGLEPAWLVEGDRRRLQLNRQGRAETTFLCQPPNALQTISQVYPFTVEACLRSQLPVKVAGSVEVLPIGDVELDCTSWRQIPNRQSEQRDVATYTIHLENKSNLRQQIDVEIAGKDEQTCSWDLSADQVEVGPGEAAELSLTVQTRRPRWGFPKKLLLDVIAHLYDPRIVLQDNPQTVELEVLPIVPAWLQVMSGLTLLALAALMVLIRPQGHQGPVMAVQFNGQADQVVSGSNDQTIRSWQVGGRGLRPQLVSESTAKAVRVVRYRPVNNNLVAIGLENGEIQLRDLLSHQLEPLQSFAYQQDDRIFDLAFTSNSRYLFSGHGSGLVLQWDLNGTSLDGSTSQQPMRRQKLDFAVSTLALVGQDQLLAVGGRFNRLVLWDWDKNQRYSLSYRQDGGQDDYILSLATPENKPHLLATADNQGYITLWDVSQCLTALKDGCEEQLDQWRDEVHGGGPIRSVAFSANGCYLATAGDDGHAMLWALGPDHKRDRRSINGKSVGQSSARLNAIDIVVANGSLRLATGSDNNQVKIYQTSRSNTECQ